MKRGDVVTVAMQGDHGKPRPAVVIQSDLINETHNSMAILPFSSNIVDAPLFRLTVEPTVENGLMKTSQVMVDKIMTPRVTKIGQILGKLEDKHLMSIDRLLAVILGIA